MVYIHICQKYKISRTPGFFIFASNRFASLPAQPEQNNLNFLLVFFAGLLMPHDLIIFLESS